MKYPSIDDLLKVIDSKYRLAIITGQRSVEMEKTHYFQKDINEYKSKKNIGRALEEVVDGLIIIDE